MTELKITNYTYINPITLKFHVEHTDSSFLNAIRRIMMGQVPTIGFRTEYGKESDIKILKNTAALHNEFLAHRLSLLPIHYNYTKIDEFDSNKLLFILQKKNNTNRIMDVTTEDIDVKDISKDPHVIMPKTFRDTLFPRDTITGDYILINKLKPSKSGMSDEGEELDITMKATIGTGNEHALFCPTCVAIFSNVEDPEKVEIGFQSLIDKKNSKRTGNPLTKEEIDKERRSFNILDAARHFFTDERGEPNKFEFVIETDERIPSHIILLTALDIFKNHITKFSENVKDKEKIEIYNSNCIMNSYDLVIEDEDYTLGYLLQYYIYKLYKNVETPVVNYIASNVPHPLENKLVFRVGMVETSTNPEALRTLFVNTCEVIKKDITNFRLQISSQ
tara:strand:+ start:4228 stop:5400 length:1173 start_codon:yes stop_codon:yes gene_type:complete